MILLFTMLHNQKGLKSFSFKPANLETGLDFISYLCREGEEVISAHIIDDDCVTELPIDSFDGVPFSAPIQKLTRQWEAILATPLPKTSSPKKISPSPIHANLIQERIEWTIHQVELIESRIENVTLTLNKIEQLRDEELIKSMQGVTPLYQRYQTQSILFKSQLVRLSAHYNLLLQRLNLLVDI